MVIIVYIVCFVKYLLFLIQESSKEGLVRLDIGSFVDIDMDVCLVIDSVEYYVLFVLFQGSEEVIVIIKKVEVDVLCWDSIWVLDIFDMVNRDKFCLVYYYILFYGWMNDVNGLVYKDGEYYFYF